MKVVVYRSPRLLSGLLRALYFKLFACVEEVRRLLELR